MDQNEEKEDSPVKFPRLTPDEWAAMFDAVENHPLSEFSVRLYRNLRRLTTPTTENLAQFLTSEGDVILVTDFDTLQFPDLVLGKLRIVLSCVLEKLVKSEGKGKQADDEAHIVIEVVRNLSRSETHKDKLTKLSRLIRLLLQIVPDPALTPSLKFYALGILSNVATSSIAIVDLLPVPEFFQTLTRFIGTDQSSSENREWAVALLSNVCNTSPVAAGMLYNLPLFVETSISVIMADETAACREWGLKVLCGLCTIQNQPDVIRLYQREGFLELLLRYVRNPRLEDVKEGPVHLQLREAAIDLVGALTLTDSLRQRLVQDGRILDLLLQVLSSDDPPRMRYRTLEVFRGMAWRASESTTPVLYAYRPLLFWLLDEIRAGGTRTYTPQENFTRLRWECWRNCVALRLVSGSFELFVTLSSAHHVSRLSWKCAFKMIPMDLIRMAAQTLLW